ncbi:MAG: hypothetical protein NXI31_16435 [bacterium]|nr:hypothetical protein [bacterium]
MSDRDDEVFGRQLEWGVGELTERRTPTDLAAAVMSRLDEEVTSTEQRDQSPARRRVWLAAAVVLLGSLAVVGVRYSRGSQGGRAEAGAGQESGREFGAESGRGGRQDPAAIEPQNVPVTIVRTLAELSELPQNVLGVELVGFGFDGIDRLQKRCPYVRMLRLRGTEVEGATVFRAMWLRHLRHLDLVNCPNVPERVVREISKHRRLCEVRFGAQPWLAKHHLERLAAAGIALLFADAGHPLQSVAAELRERFEARLRERRVQRAAPIPFVVVRSIVDIAALPSDTLAVDGLNLRDDAIGALARLGELRHLRLRSGRQARDATIADREAEYHPATDESNRASISDAGLAQLVPLGRLETLELAGTVGVTGSGLRHLERLPALRELALIAIDTSDAGMARLPFLPALRSLRLERNHGFSRAGLVALAHCERLEALTLTACVQLAGNDYEELSHVRGLRDLRLRQLGVDSWRNDSKRQLSPEEDAAAAAVRRAAENRVRLVDDGVVEQIVTGLPELRRFELTFAWITDQALASIGRLRHLRHLDLARNTEITAAGLAKLPRGIEHLGLGGCEAIDDRLNDVVRDRFPRLVSLNANAVTRLTRLDGLVTAPTLRELSLWGCHQIGSAGADALRWAEGLRYLDVSAARGIPAELLDLLRARGVAVKQKVW